MERQTRSVCPVCLRPLPAVLETRPDGVYMVKNCPEHGHFEAPVWRNRLDWDSWLGGLPPLGPGEGERCPADCGLCGEHQRGTCCTILEVTDRCNLRCRYCFAGGDRGADRPLEDVKRDLAALAVPGKTLVQLSGGEPTVRDDLPEIIRYAKAAGCKYVQLNTNGVRLAADMDYVNSLAGAGLSFVFLQFDALKDEAYEKIRGRALWKEKLQCIVNCARAHLGVVLVVTVVPGVNDGMLGDILRFGAAMSPAVRGVHFQPVTYLGNYPCAPADAARMTLDELIEKLEEQSGGLIRRGDLAPSRCDHPLCGFHGDFIAMPGEFRALTRWTGRETGCSATADQNREFVGRRWLRPEGDCCCNPDASTLDGFLDNAKVYGFTVTSMAFQDAGNFNVERLRYCSSHVYRDGKFVPLCAYYLAPQKQPEPRHPGGRALTERLLELAALPAGARTADVGCGEGAGVALLRARGFLCTGVEPAVNGSAEALPFEAGSLDAILSECVLCLAERAAALAEAARVLRPGGKLLVSDVYERGTAPEFPGFRVLAFEDRRNDLRQWLAQSILDGTDCDFLPEKGKKYSYYLAVLEKP